MEKDNSNDSIDSKDIEENESIQKNYSPLRNGLILNSKYQRRNEKY